jgi:hypothetical protein
MLEILGNFPEVFAILLGGGGGALLFDSDRTQTVKISDRQYY